jgi:hypothetical protein
VSRSYLVLDIETVPDRDMPWDAAKEGFPPPPFHEVVTVGALWLEPDLTFQRIGVFGVPHGAETHHPSEAEVLEAFAQFVGKARPHIVTYNGRRFDLPVLANRCLKHGVAFGAYYQDRDYRYRFSDLGHVDLADFLTDHGASIMTSLDNLAHLIGLPGKMDVDGSKVQQLHDAGEVEAIRAYCLQDVLQTAVLFLRCELLRGRIDRDAYRSRVQELWDALGHDPRVQEVFERSHRARLLLE